MGRWWRWTRRRVAPFDEDVIDGFSTNNLLVLTIKSTKAVYICVCAMEGAGVCRQGCEVHKSSTTVALDALVAD